MSVGALARGTAGVAAILLSVALVVRFGDDVRAPFLIVAGGGAVVSLALARVIASGFLLLGAARTLPRPCR